MATMQDVVNAAGEAFRVAQLDIANQDKLLTGPGDVTITKADGQTITGPSWVKLAANTVVLVNGAVPVAQGGTGGKNQAEARSGLGLGTSSTRNINQDMVNPSPNEVLVVGSGGIGTNTLTRTVLDGIKGGGMYSASASLGGIGNNVSYLYMPYNVDTGYEIIMPTILGTAPRMYLRTISTNTQYNGQLCEVYTTLNTTKAADGTLKAASPIVSVFHDGRAETNDESEGCTVTRQGAGVYLIEGCMGLNADAAWGGIDGGFDVPKDRNRQPLVWLDYEVNPDGSILVKTYHRTYHDAPEFARNLIGVKNEDGSFTETIKSGEPVDIPADQFISVRVNMPQTSVYNEKLRVQSEHIEEAERSRKKMAEWELEAQQAAPGIADPGTNEPL